MQPSIVRPKGTTGHAVQHVDIPPLQSATLGLHLVARNLLLISRALGGMRLSCLQMESYESDTLPLDHLCPQIY